MQVNTQTTPPLVHCFLPPSDFLILYSVLLTVAGLLLLYLIRKLRQERSAQLTLRNEVAENERHFRFIAENSADVIWTMDLTGGFTYISPSVEKLRGYTVDEVLAQTAEEVLPTSKSATEVADLLTANQRATPEPVLSNSAKSSAVTPLPIPMA